MTKKRSKMPDYDDIHKEDITMQEQTYNGTLSKKEIESVLDELVQTSQDMGLYDEETEDEL